MAVLEFRDVTVRFGHGHNAVDAVRKVSLTVPPGRTLGLVGESGSGKSTLVRAAVGLTEPTEGQILLDGVDVTHARGKTARFRRQIQMVFQDAYSCLDPRFTIGDSIGEALSAADARTPAKSRSRSERREEVHRLLTLVGLDPDRATAHPSALSGGQRQRVALARALAARPSVLLADEITSALDVSVQGAVLNLLVELQQALDLSVLFISHNLAVVRHVCDQVAVMYGGQIIEEGTTLDVLEDPQEQYTKQLLASVPRIGVPLFTSPATV
jgi:peptide/nickel transport system ATP-binding protein